MAIYLIGSHYIFYSLWSVVRQNRKLALKWYSVSSLRKKWLKSAYFGFGDKKGKPTCTITAKVGLRKLKSNNYYYEKCFV